MKTSMAAMCWILLLVHGGIASAQLSEAQSLQTSAAEQRIRAAMQDETRLEFIETPLDQVLHFLRDLHDIPIWLDTHGLDQQGIAADVPITADIKKISLQSALSLILGELELEWAIRDESLVITSAVAARRNPACRVYLVGDLIVTADDTERLAEVLTAATEVQRGDGIPNSGPRILPYHQFLIVRGTEKQQNQVTQLLTQMRQLLKPPSPATVQPEREKRQSAKEPVRPATDREPTAERDPFGGSGSGDNPFKRTESNDDPFAGGANANPFDKPPKSKRVPPAGDDPFGS